LVFQSSYEHPGYLITARHGRNQMQTTEARSTQSFDSFCQAEEVACQELCFGLCG
jgi:hypothetical protein